MKSNLFFGMSLDFDVTLNQQLEQLSAIRFYDKGLQRYLYIFPVDALGKVAALTGKELNFEDQKPELLNLIVHAPGLKEEIGLDKWKGKGMLQIQEFPKLFVVSTIIRKKPETFHLPVETVKAAWKAIKTMEKGKVKSSKDLAEKWCQELGITRFHRQTGSWDGDKLYGCRETYFKWYFSLKILQHYGLIDYSKDGKVTRLADSWELQGSML